ncbi:hypothetical protein [Streptosporangium lutulentum]|uniref:Uncharacterized protein n=1 Tax=Streptosporangium lutulentum TaxID=1461250 RepID=A0ABT9Q973_9ACTN|nr:hypothetical protein [Streptosporangium lutulentum]MDP9843300.1 hypothetical protein [Streptosporangium lutulentum]
MSWDDFDFDYGYGRRRMSSRKVAIGAIGTLATIVIGAAVVAEINDDDTDDDAVTAVCVDPNSMTDEGLVIVDDRFCTPDGSHSGYVYVFGGSSSGNRISGGTTFRPGDVTITTRKGTVIQRGGFGGRGGSGGS